MSRRKRSDAVATSIEVAAKAFSEIKPPTEWGLNDIEQEIFQRILGESDLASWTPHKVDLAAGLAREMNMMRVNQSLLDSEGLVLKDRSERFYENPRVRIVKGMAASIIAMRRSLGIHSRAKDGEARDASKRRATRKAQETAMMNVGDLIARPN